MRCETQSYVTMKPPKFCVFLMLLCSVWGLQGQIDKTTRHSLKRIIAASEFSRYRTITSKYGYVKWIGHLRSDLLQENLVFSSQICGNVRQIREVKENYELVPSSRFSYGHGLKRRSRWEATPLEESVYIFDSLNSLSQLDVRTITAQHRKNVKFTAHHSHVGAWSTTFEETYNRYLFQDGQPWAWQRRAEQGHFYYVESLQYDSSKRVCTVFKFDQGYLNDIYTYTYHDDSLTEKHYEVSNLQSIYTLPIFPKNYEQCLTSEVLKYTSGYDGRFDSVLSSSPIYQYDSEGRILSITANSDQQPLGKIYRNYFLTKPSEFGMCYPAGSNILKQEFQYDSSGNVTQISYCTSKNDKADDWAGTWEYTYDTVGNWVECRYYFEGNLISYTRREITYWD